MDDRKPLFTDIAGGKAKPLVSPDITTTVAADASKKLPTKPKNQLQNLIFQGLDEHGYSEETIAELLSAQSGKSVKRSTISSWKSGSEPRGGANFWIKHLTDLFEEFPSKPSKVSKEEVQKQTLIWLETFNAKQLCIAAEIAQATLSTYKNGKVSVANSRWNRIKMNVENAISRMKKHEKS